MPKKSLLINIFTALISSLLLFLCLELFVRVNPQLYCEGYRPSKNAKLVYELQPGHKMTLLRAEISSQGLNDRYFTIKKSPGVYRIAVIGDSTSFGWKVGAAKSFPKILERMLNDGKGKHKRFEVINFSVPGYNPSQEFEVLKEKAIKFNPDMVILCFCGNDTHVCNYIQPDLTVFNYLYNKSYFFHYVLRRIDLTLMSSGSQRLKSLWFSFKKNILGMFYFDQIIYSYPGLEETIYIEGNPPVKKERVPYKYWDMIGDENYKIHLSYFREFLESRHIPFILVGFFTDEMLKINETVGVKKTYDFLQLSQKDGIAYHEISLKNDWHLNGRGHALCAGYLYERLKDIQTILN